MTYYEVSRRIADAINWNQVDPETILKFRRGFLDPYEVVLKHPDCASSYYQRLSEKVKEGVRVDAENDARIAKQMKARGL